MGRLGDHVITWGRANAAAEPPAVPTSDRSSGAPQYPLWPDAARGRVRRTKRVSVHIMDLTPCHGKGHFDNMVTHSLKTNFREGIAIIERKKLKKEKENKQTTPSPKILPSELPS